MNIQINGEQQTISKESLTVAELLALNNVESPDLVTVQLNGNFVDRKLFASTGVQQNDEIDFLYFLGGGGGR